MQLRGAICVSFIGPFYDRLTAARGRASPICAANFLERLVGLPRFLHSFVALQFFLGLLALNHLIGPLSNLFEIVGFRTMQPPI
jgi:hypothetical protein